VIHHEVGESQQEIEIDYAEAKRMADFVLLFKNLARAVTQNYGLDASFMPKPFTGSAGNGLHCHMQLWDGDKNLFGTDKGDDLSETGKMFVAGLLHHAPAITALANPSVNSYKRLVPHYEAPVYISWGLRNRTVLIRVPQFDTGDKAAIELRSPDATANPYLLFSAVIAAGMDGVKRELKPPEPRSEDVFHITDEERDALGIGTLPATLDDALNQLEESSLMEEALGHELVETYLKVKREEWMEYQSFIVTEFEWEKYHNI
jgi:glutamine synthetase